MNRRWIPLGILAALAVSSLATMEHAQGVTGGPVVLGDTAWLLTATGLVLLMTPGLAFFYGGMVSTKNVISTMLQSWWRSGSSAPSVLSVRWLSSG